MRQSSLKVHAMFGNIVVWTRTASTGSQDLRPPTYTFILNVTALFNLHISIRQTDRRGEPNLSVM